MPKMSKKEMLIRVAALAHDKYKLIAITNFGVIECELNDLVTQDQIDKNEPCTPLQTNLSCELDSDVQKVFDACKDSDQEFILLKNAVIHYPSGGILTMDELALFLDSVVGFSVGHLDLSDPNFD